MQDRLVGGPPPGGGEPLPEEPPPHPGKTADRAQMQSKRAQARLPPATDFKVFIVDSSVRRERIAPVFPNVINEVILEAGQFRETLCRCLSISDKSLRTQASKYEAQIVSVVVVMSDIPV
jgi:hypothetical protein